jgi:hypothetical protein
MEEVVRELESHTGILVQSSFETFEFSHLSLQEYLAAHYIVREPSLRNIRVYLEKYAPPVAIAVALSSNPSVWLATILLRFYERPYFDRLLTPMLHRVMLERPYFSVDVTLGVAFLKVLGDVDCSKMSLRQHPGSRIELDVILRFLQVENICESIVLALEGYAVLLNESRDSVDKSMLTLEMTTNRWSQEVMDNIEVDGIKIANVLEVDRRLIGAVFKDNAKGIRVRAWRGNVSVMPLSQLDHLLQDT